MTRPAPTMDPHIAAITAALAALGMDVHYVDAGERPAYPYVVLWGSGGLWTTRSLAGPADFADRLGVTTADYTPEGVRRVLPLVRGVLDDAVIPVPGRHVELHLADARAIDVDRTVVIPESNRHPAYGVDLYDLTSVPTP